MEFDIPENEIKDMMHSLDELQELSNQNLSEFDLLTGMVEKNKNYHIRTGIIQDPNYPAFKNRVDSNGNELEGVYTTTNNIKAKYPLNCKNSVDTYGMRVSIVWLDGNETGLHYDATKTSSIGKPVQKLWLTFPQAWSDRDRSCGDFSLPVTGTICRIGVVRGDVGVYLGAIPHDKGNLPNINPGDFLRRTHNQNSQYITNNTTRDAYLNVLDKDLYKKKLKLQAIPPNEKEYETDETLLNNVYQYHSNRHTIACDGVSTSTKVTKNKHSSICKKRIFEWNTNKNLETAFNELLSILGSLANCITVKLLTTEGELVVTQTEDNKFVASLVTTKDIFDAIDFIKNNITDVKTFTINSNNAFINVSNDILNSSFTINSSELTLTEILVSLLPKYDFITGVISCKDVNMNFNCNTGYTLPSFTINSNILTIAQIALILSTNFVTALTVNASINSSDALMNWNLRRGSIYSSITLAESLEASAILIMGRPGKYFSAVGSNRVISGDCPLPDTPISINTCSLPNL